MAPVHFPLLVHVLKDFGYTLKLLPTVSDHAVTLGLRYVNNDACYPAIVTIGQLLEATEAKDFVPEKVQFSSAKPAALAAPPTIRHCSTGRCATKVSRTFRY